MIINGKRERKGQMNPLERLHPLSILFYYVSAVCLLAGIRHPLAGILVWIVACIHYVCLAGSRKGFRMLWYSLGAAALCVVINPLLNHRGVTLLFRLGEWRITREAVLYGMYMAVMLMASLLLFSCFSYNMTAEKIMTLFGKRFPSFALLFSMILRFVPRAGRDFHAMTALHGNRPAVWSALSGFSLEDAIERSLSMKDRNYKSGKRSSYYHRRMNVRDILFLLFSFLTVVGLYGCQWIMKREVRFFPRIHIDRFPLWMWAVLLFFFSLPLIWQGKEELAWHISRRRIIVTTTRMTKAPQSTSTD